MVSNFVSPTSAQVGHEVKMRETPVTRGGASHLGHLPHVWGPNLPVNCFPSVRPSVQTDGVSQLLLLTYSLSRRGGIGGNSTCVARVFCTPTFVSEVG
jgi:hypothetical protein